MRLGVCKTSLSPPCFYFTDRSKSIVGEPKSCILQNDKKIAPDFDTVEFLYIDSLNSARYGATL